MTMNTTLVSVSPSLLALHAHAIALRGSGRATWALVDAYRAEHSASGYGWGNAGGETERAEDAALYAAFHAAEKAEHDSIANLCAAIRAAEWGQQPDGSFVARHSTQIGRMPDVHTLHAPAKQGPLCEVRNHERGPGSRLAALRTREEARDIASAQRCDNRDTERAYAGLRRRAGAVLAAGEALPFVTGQEYGAVKIHDRWVSARGALVAAGLTKEAALADALRQEESKQDPAADLLAMDGMSRDLAYALAARGIITVDDLAEQAIDDLQDIENLDAELAGRLIMKARESWFN